MNKARNAAIAVLPALLVVVLYRKVVRLWWTYDDAYLIHLAIDHSLADSFFSASVWSQKLFTPMVMAAFETDLAVFGLDPARWFIVHLIFLFASVIAFHAALRLYFAPWAAGAAALLYAASVPMVSLITEISGIHYLMAILFGSLATIAYVVSLRSGRAWLTIVSAFILLIGMLAKETVIPLPFFYLALPERDLRARLRYAAPHALALAIYFIWRHAVIGTALGGYGWAVDGSEWPMLIAALPKKIILASAGVHVPLGITLIVLMATGVAFAVKQKKGALILLVALSLATGPILPVSKEMQRRYALMPWLCWSVAFLAGAEAMRKRSPRAGTALVAIVPLLMIVVNRQEWGYELGRSQRMSDEARFFFDMPPGTLLRGPIVPPAAMGEVNWLKTIHLRKPSGAMYFYDDYFLCANDVTGRRAWEYAPDRRAIVEITSGLSALAQRHCGAIRNDVSLFAEFDYRDASLFWEFGPFHEGRYRVLFVNGQQAFDVPREAGFRLPDLPGLTLRIRYDSPEGWTTYSPDIALDFVRRPKTAWRR